MSQKSTVRYSIDAQDRLVAIDPGWDAFAHANGAPDLSAERLLGSLIWDHLEGEEVVRVYEILHKRVRERSEPVTIEFRCDGVDLERSVLLEMRPAERGRIDYECRVLAEARRLPIGLLDASAERDERIVRVCSYCKSIAVSEDRWESTSDAFISLGLDRSSTMPQLSHGICPQCYEMVAAQALAEIG